MSRHKYSLAAHPEARQRALWLIRDYPNIKARVEDIDGFGSGASDGGPRSTLPHSSTEDQALRRTEISWQVDAVEKALDKVPEEYQAGIWSNIVYRQRFPNTAGIKTWKRWKQRFIWWTAWFAGYI